MLPSQNRPLQSEILMASSRKSKPEARTSDTSSTIKIIYKQDSLNKLLENSSIPTKSVFQSKNGIIQEELIEEIDDGEKIELGLLKGDQESGFSQTSSSPYIGGIETPTAYDGTGMAKEKFLHVD